MNTLNTFKVLNSTHTIYHLKVELYCYEEAKDSLYPLLPITNNNKVVMVATDSSSLKNHTNGIPKKPNSRICG